MDNSRAVVASVVGAVIGGAILFLQRAPLREGKAAVTAASAAATSAPAARENASSFNENAEGETLCAGAAAMLIAA